MKSWIHALQIAISMYSIFPVKCSAWTKENLRHAMLFFPLVGILCGFGLSIVWLICCCLRVSAVLFGVLGVLSLVLITGGIHLDGFCDTVDALYSRRPMAEKLRILKDPNCGPFAVFGVVLVLLVQFGAFVELYRIQNAEILGLCTGVFFSSRCFSGVSITRFSIAPTSSLAKTFGENAGKHVSVGLLVLAFLAAVVLLFFWDWLALVLLAILAVTFWGYYRMQKKQFGGLTGDLAGFFLVLCETGMLLAAALLGGVWLCT